MASFIPKSITGEAPKSCNETTCRDPGWRPSWAAPGETQRAPGYFKKYFAPFGCSPCPWNCLSAGRGARASPG